MGIIESQEWLLDIVIDCYSDISGIKTGVEEDTLVGYGFAVSFWTRVCNAVHLKAQFVPGLHTIEDYVHQLSSLMRKQNASRKVFLQNLAAFVTEKTKRAHHPKEILFNELLPHSVDATQNLREEMYYVLEVDNLKNLIRSKYGYFQYTQEFVHAQTLDEITDVLFGKEYPVGSSL